MTTKHFGDWRDEASDAIVSEFMDAIEAVWPAVQQAKIAGDDAEAQAIIRRALEGAAPFAADEFELFAKKFMGDET